MGLNNGADDLQEQPDDSDDSAYEEFGEVGTDVDEVEESDPESDAGDLSMPVDFEGHIREAAYEHEHPLY